MIKYANICQKGNIKFYRTNNNDTIYSFVDEEDLRVIFFYPYLRNGLKVADVGCGVGSYTLPALEKGCNIKAFSPDIPEMEIFRNNLKLNENLAGKCKFIGKCLYSKEGYLNPQTKEFSKVWKDSKGKPEELGNYFFPCTTIDDAFKKEKLDYIKIDVEGFEYDVILGAEKTIKRDLPTILVENHDFMDNNMAQKIIDLITKEWTLGYRHDTRKYHSVSHTLFKT